MLMIVQIDRVVGFFSMSNAYVEGGESPSVMVQKFGVEVGCEAFLHHKVKGSSGRSEVNP